jgi:hypothetical protein
MVTSTVTSAVLTGAEDVGTTDGLADGVIEGVVDGEAAGASVEPQPVRATVVTTAAAMTPRGENRMTDSSGEARASANDDQVSWELSRLSRPENAELRQMWR